MGKTEELEEGKIISPLIKTEMELLTPSKVRGKVSRKVSENRGLGMPACVEDHQAVVDRIRTVLEKTLPKLHVSREVALKDPVGLEARNHGTNTTKYVEFDVSVWLKFFEYPDSPAENYCDDCLVGIEVEESADNRRRDKKKITKAFGFSKTLKEIFLYNFVKKDWLRYTRENGEIKEYPNCWASEALGVDMRKVVDKNTYAEMMESANQPNVLL